MIRKAYIVVDRCRIVQVVLLYKHIHCYHLACSDETLYIISGLYLGKVGVMFSYSGMIRILKSVLRECAEIALILQRKAWALVE